MDLDIVILVLILFAVVFSISITAYDAVIVNPLAAEDALNQCKERGFDYAKGFTHVFLDSNALGVECAYVEYTKKNINADIQGSGALIIG